MANMGICYGIAVDILCFSLTPTAIDYRGYEGTKLAARLPSTSMYSYTNATAWVACMDLPNLNWL